MSRRRRVVNAKMHRNHGGASEMFPRRASRTQQVRQRSEGERTACIPRSAAQANGSEEQEGSNNEI